MITLAVFYFKYFPQTYIHTRTADHDPEFPGLNYFFHIYIQHGQHFRCNNKLYFFFFARLQGLPAESLLIL